MTTKIKELEAAYEGATPGEWEQGTDYVQADNRIILICDGYNTNPINSVSGQDMANAAFIEKAHNLTPTLLEAADLLTYALQVFKDTCQCGECAPCLGAQEMEAVLEKLK